MDRKSILIGASAMVLAVIFGAFGAHGLRKMLDASELSQWQTGVQYQVYHALGCLLIATFRPHLGERAMFRVRTLFVLGILCFSGSLYLLSTRSITGLYWMAPWVGPLTPVGGLLFIAGWGMLLITVLRQVR